ncbi:winged helix-turn-helix transcriptional regulator [Methylomonas sp. MK1]|jgi:DNA-binding HxlR family transcriptional regulator|uniref:winged helix-turn-helix transcriptional regulator n=1 Tax=Methylomonas sp. MK1 TaxID=1131552 RepID=UPI0003822BC1|nr:helix-turn-helix domain-containing protein [Methylomonas sp. MK1]
MKGKDKKTCEKHRDMCSISRAIDKIGDSWSLLILRDLGQGLTRYEEFRENLEISPATLSKRLSMLVEEGLVVKKIYQDNPLRAQYVLTSMGQDFMPVLAMIMVWGNEYASPNGTDEQLVEKKTRKEISSNVVNAEKRCPDHV